MISTLLAQNSTPQLLHKRCRILESLHDRAPNFSEVARKTRCDRKTVRTWYERGMQISQQWDELAENALKEPGHAGESLRKQRLAASLLQDNPRSGAPPTYSAEIYTQIVTLALTSPEEHGIIATHWSTRELTEVIHLQKISEEISERQVEPVPERRFSE